ncbi:MAG TPA: hypothetical protein VFL57_18195 [Bryobacteraceae bacterium]|nr:hypothetical protein [Bryobacteraceae bacterium]
MATAAQITANQLNAQRSTGPRTEAGKQTVSRNARTHGLAAKKFFLSDDDKPLFAELREGLVEHYQPATDHERLLLEELAEAKWRCRTARSMEASFFEIVIDDVRKADPALTREHALAQVFLRDDLQKRMRLMMRYLSSAERAAEKARKELERVIAIRGEAEQLEQQRAAILANRLCSVPAPQAPAGPRAVAPNPAARNDSRPDSDPISNSLSPA